MSDADAAFADQARRTGSTQQAFTAWAAQDAVQLGSKMIFGRDAIHDALDGIPLIEWRPVDGAQAGDLGYTVGEYRIGDARGHYLTIWRSDADGSWRFVLDGGVSG